LLCTPEALLPTWTIYLLVVPKLGSPAFSSNNRRRFLKSVKSITLIRPAKLHRF